MLYTLEKTQVLMRLQTEQQSAHRSMLETALGRLFKPHVTMLCTVSLFFNGVSFRVKKYDLFIYL